MYHVILSKIGLDPVILKILTINNLKLNSSVSLSQWTKARQWKSQFYQNIKQDKNNENICEKTVNSEEGIPIENSDVIKICNSQMTGCKWKAFEEFSYCAFGFWKITIHKDATELN